MASPLFLSVILPIVAASILFRLEPIQPAHFPADTTSQWTLTVAACSVQRADAKKGSEGHAKVPEDLVYDAAAGILYTGCKDGWIKRVTVKELVVDSTAGVWSISEEDRSPCLRPKWLPHSC
ncbi:hypothetical protein K1719_040684 [Acacia pycnantha]|nr:hypothetical protein K1719_040684 [Acacia pycnantha]